MRIEYRHLLLIFWLLWGMSGADNLAYLEIPEISDEPVARDFSSLSSAVIGEGFLPSSSNTANNGSASSSSSSSSSLIGSGSSATGGSHSHSSQVNGSDFPGTSSSTISFPGTVILSSPSSGGGDHVSLPPSATLPSSSVGIPVDPPGPPPLVGGGGAPSVTPDPRFCREFSTGHTANATRNFCSCRFGACNSELVSIHACHCSGPVRLRFFEVSTLYEIAGTDIWEDFNFCGNGCPSYGFRNSFPYPCRQFGILGGCLGDAHCSARVSVVVAPPFRSLQDRESDVAGLTRDITADLVILAEDHRMKLLRNNTTRLSDDQSSTDATQTDDRLSRSAPDDGDDDEYFTSPYPYLLTTCPRPADGGSSDVPELVMVASVTAACFVVICVGCCTLLRMFFPEFLITCVADVRQTWFEVQACCICFATCGTCSLGFQMSKQKVAVAPAFVVPEPTLVDLTPIERQQGFFLPANVYRLRNEQKEGYDDYCRPFHDAGDRRHRNSVDRGDRRLTDIEDRDEECLSNDADEEEDASCMCELDDDDPRVLAKLARKQAKAAAQRQRQAARRTGSVAVDCSTTLNCSSNSILSGITPGLSQSNASDSVSPMGQSPRSSQVTRSAALDGGSSAAPHAQSVNSVSVYYDEELGEIPLVEAVAVPAHSHGYGHQLSRGSSYGPSHSTTPIRSPPSSLRRP